MTKARSTARSMPKTAKPLLPTRMSLNPEALQEVRYARLDFPYQKALDAFLDQLQKEYNAEHHVEAKTWLPKEKQPPFRQLNQAIMAICPVLVHAFEQYDPIRSMVAINRLTRDPNTGAIIDQGDQYPSADAFADLIDIWIDQWLENTGLRELVNQRMDRAFKALKAALAQPETGWQPDITLDYLIQQVDQSNPLSYNMIPAAIITLLHGQSMTLQQGDVPQKIIWRKAHDGGTNGLHLVSQPFHTHFTKVKRGKSEDGQYADTEVIEDGYFVYCLRVSVQTQVGRLENGLLKPWIFLHVGMRRYIHEPFAKDKVWRRKISMLVGFNRDNILPENRRAIDRFPYDTTLVALSATYDRKRAAWVWTEQVADLLNTFGLTGIADPQAILNDPTRYGNLGNHADFTNNEYYELHTEGRTYHAPDYRKGQGHGHHVTVGLSLKESTEIVQRVLALLPDMLIPDQPFEQDIEAPTGHNVPLILRKYSFFKPSPGWPIEKTLKKVGETVDAIRRAVKSAGKDDLDIAIVGYDSAFKGVIRAEIEAMFPGQALGASAFFNILDVTISPLLLNPLDPGTLDPADWFDSKKRTKEFMAKWKDQMKHSRYIKVEDWQRALTTIQWRPNAHRVAIIESRYKDKKFRAVHESQEIKSAVREACCRAGVASQLLGHFKVTGEKLTAANKGRLENGLLDLLLRGTGAVYGSPADMYMRTAKLDPSIASVLDVVAFWHVQTKTELSFKQLTTVLAVRLRADGGIQIFAPGMSDWMPYAQAASVMGVQFADLRSALRNQGPSGNLLQMENRAVMGFVLDVLKNRLDAPTIAIIKADWWRNAKPSADNADIPRWPQLGNTRLFKTQDILDFSHVRGGSKFERNDPHFANLLAVIRLRMDSETPQYTTTPTWDAAGEPVDLKALSGYVDCTVTEPLHYFSVAAESGLQKRQTKDFEGGYKYLLPTDYAYKHAQLVEMLPFFVREDFSGKLNNGNTDGRRVLCRCVHFLRISPAFTKGNTLCPYPMHLAKLLLDDLLCIVEAKKD